MERKTRIVKKTKIKCRIYLYLGNLECQHLTWHRTLLLMIAIFGVLPCESLWLGQSCHSYHTVVTFLHQVGILDLLILYAFACMLPPAKYFFLCQEQILSIWVSCNRSSWLPRLIVIDIRIKYCGVRNKPASTRNRFFC